MLIRIDHRSPNYALFSLKAMSKYDSLSLVDEIAGLGIGFSISDDEAEDFIEELEVYRVPFQEENPDENLLRRAKPAKRTKKKIWHTPKTTSRMSRRDRRIEE